VNGSDISSAVKGINDALAAAGISTVSASEDDDGKLVITGSETYQITEALSGSYAGLGLMNETTIQLAGGAATDTFDVNVNGNQLAAAVAFNTDLATTAGDLVTAINADATLAALVTATASGDTVTLRSSTGFSASSIANDVSGSGVAATTDTTELDGVAKTYDYNALADYLVGDVVTGIREDGSQESFLISTAVTGNGRTFDEFAALANTTRLNNNINPNAEVWTSSGSYAAGDVVYDDRNGRYYVSRTGPAVGTATSSKADYLELGNSLPGLSDFAAYDESKQYFADDIVSYDGQLYLATPAATPVTEGEGSPIDNSTDWTRLNISVKGSQSLLDSDNDLADFSVADLRAMIQVAATSRAQNGAEQYRLEKSNEMLATNQANLEAANSKLYDVDVATESTAFARANILVQSSAAMLAQANNAQTVALSLLQ
jgi:flagellin-like hook-associated protein FlgL